METFKNVIGYEGIYSVSNYGNVRRDKAYATTKVGKIIKPSIHKHGYPRVALFKKSIRKYFYVHVLVANAFICKKPKGMEVNHKDTNRANPHVDNLEYLTPSENIRYSFTIPGHRKPAKGISHGMCKISEKDVIAIRNEWDIKKTAQRTIAKKFGINQSQVWRIIHRKTWVHI